MIVTNKALELDEDTYVEIRECMYKMFRLPDNRPDIFMLELMNDSNNYSFGRTLNKTNFYYDDDEFTRKYKNVLERFNSDLIKSKKKFYDKTIGDNARDFILSKLPEELKDGHILFGENDDWGIENFYILNVDEILNSKTRVETYLEKYIVLDKEKEYTFQLFQDKSCKMQWVYFNDVCINGGNTWDFHNGCNGCDIPTYKGAINYIQVLSRGLKSLGYKVTVLETEDKDYIEWSNS